jgi:hypothetical protein
MGFQRRVDLTRPKIPSPCDEGGGSGWGWTIKPLSPPSQPSPPQGGRRLKGTDHIAIGTSPQGEGFPPSPKGTKNSTLKTGSRSGFHRSEMNPLTAEKLIFTSSSFKILVTFNVPIGHHHIGRHSRGCIEPCQRDHMKGERECTSK